MMMPPRERRGASKASHSLHINNNRLITENQEVIFLIGKELTTMEDTITVNKNALGAIVDLFDSIGSADRRYKACQNSAFRMFIREKQQMDMFGFEALEKAAEKSEKKGLSISRTAAGQLMKLMTAMDEAESLYPFDQAGNQNYRDYVRGVWKAQLNQNAVEAARNVLA